MVIKITCLDNKMSCSAIRYLAEQGLQARENHEMGCGVTSTLPCTLLVKVPERRAEEIITAVDKLKGVIHVCKEYQPRERE